jgi:hypothetical protein
MNVLIGFGGVVLGFALSAIWQWWRDKANASHQKKLLAGALAAELEAFAAACPRTQQDIVDSGLSPLSIAVYRASGQRLHLLGQALATDVIACYFSVQNALADIDKARVMTADAAVQPRRPGSAERRGEGSANRWRALAVEAADKACVLAEQVTPKLRRVAAIYDGDDASGSSDATTQS